MNAHSGRLALGRSATATSGSSGDGKRGRRGWVVSDGEEAAVGVDLVHIGNGDQGNEVLVAGGEDGELEAERVGVGVDVVADGVR